MIVAKFGGTSVGTPEAMKKAAAIAAAIGVKEKIVVTSAMSGVTDSLLNLAKLAAYSDGAGLWESFDGLKAKHEEAIKIFSVSGAGNASGEVSEIFSELRRVLEGLALLRELTPRSLDLVASVGERLSAPILAAALRQAGAGAIPFDARKAITTDDSYTAAEVDFKITNENLKALLLPILKEGIIPVVTGFIAGTSEGATTTLGRGGSDYTAAIVGAALGAEEIQIWTDVDGIMSADPRIVSGAKILPEVSYSEAMEMSYFGAKVIHPKTMLPAFESGIPIVIKNTFNPIAPGTRILKEIKLAGSGVKVITSIPKVSMVTVGGIGMRGRTGFAAKLFEAAGAVRANILMITQASSEQSICVLVSRGDGKRLYAALGRVFSGEMQSKIVESIILDEDVSAVAVVGAGMRGTPGIAGAAFGAAAEAGVNILAIAQGSSELNISFVVKSGDMERAVQGLHKALIA